MKAVKIFLVVALFLVPAFVAYAQTHEHDHSKEKVTITGTLKCSSCNLKKEHGAGAQCSVYGCQYSFKVDDVTNEKGKSLDEYKGKTFTILLNDNSKELVVKEHKKTQFVIEGYLYPEDNMIEVIKFSESKSKK